MTMNHDQSNLTRDKTTKRRMERFA